MKKLIKIDEENITRSNLRISSGIFLVIILIFMIIYIPKYFREYQTLQKNTEENFVDLFKHEMKNDIDQLESNIRYRIKINQENIKFYIMEQTNLYYNFTKNQYRHYKFDDRFTDKKIYNHLATDFAELFSKDSTGLSFIGYKDQIRIYKNGNLDTHEIFNWSEFKEKYKDKIFVENKIISLRDCFKEVLKDKIDTFVNIRYYKPLDFFVGKIYCHNLVREIVESKIVDEINLSYGISSENYIFIYKILNMEGGKGFAKMIVNPNRLDLVGNLIDDDYQDVKGNTFRKKFMEDIRKNGESFTTYWYKSPSDSLIHPKTAYFKFFPEFDWVIAKGFYYTQINDIIKVETDKHLRNFILRIVLLIALMSTALLLYYFTFKIMLKKQEKRLKEYKDNLIDKNTQLEQEINKSKTRELELENLNKYINNLYELTPVGIVLIRTKDKTIARINQTALNLIGFKKDDILDQKCNICFCPALEGACPIIDQNNTLDNAERAIINSKKEIIPVLKNAKKITIDNEDYILESFIDITEIKKTQNKLIELRKTADEANVSKSRFLANMSHEIRTPMNVIMGMSNLLLESEFNEEKKDLLNSIKISSDSLLNIINDILDLSKIESGKYTSEKIPFNLHKLLSSIKDISLFKAKEKNIEFDIEFSRDELPKYVSGDQVRIKQIIINLVGNALKFTEKGFVKLNLKVINKSEDIIILKFSVVDTGIGISKEALENIFKRFTQADISTTRKYGGTGLGLTICKKLLEIMGSKLEVTSTEGEGSEFFFELSFEMPDKIRIPNEVTLNSTELKKLKNKNILVAEDNPLNQKLITAILNQKHLNHTIANNGKEVVEMLEQEHYDMILMDGQMPVMDGLEATNIIRNSGKKYKDIPIIALTASALIGDRQKFLDVGMNDYISKPIDITELFDKISIYANGINIPNRQPNNKKSEKNNKTQNDITDKIINLPDFEEKKKIFGKESYINILDMLLNDIDTKLDMITKFLENNNMSSLKVQTHSLKGIITNFDTPKINNLCIQLDQFAIDKDPEKLKLTLEKIKTIVPEYRSKILEFIETL